MKLAQQWAKERNEDWARRNNAPIDYYDDPEYLLRRFADDLTGERREGELFALYERVRATSPDGMVRSYHDLEQSERMDPKVPSVREHLTKFADEWAKRNGLPKVESGNWNETPLGQLAYRITGDRDREGELFALYERVRAGSPDGKVHGYYELAHHAGVERIHNYLQVESSGYSDSLSGLPRPDETIAAAKERWEAQPEEVRYQDDFEAFLSDYDAAVARAAAGEPMVPYLEKAEEIGGIGRRLFGVELEFDLRDPSSKMMAHEGIAHRLDSEGLAENAGAARDAGGKKHGDYTTNRASWRINSDGTVNGGELISPKSDPGKPETWGDLRKVRDIAVEHGGVISSKTSVHVHIDTSDFRGFTPFYSRLMRTFTAYQNTLYDLAVDLETGSHDDTQYYQPNMNLIEDYRSVDAIRSGKRQVGLNFQSVIGEAGDHVEFRLWRGTFDPGVVQVRQKISDALVESAAREALNPDLPNGGIVDLFRASDRRPGALDRNSPEFAAQTEPLRRMIDELFRRGVDKAQVVALFAQINERRT